jgi:hypothetical protein
MPHWRSMMDSEWLRACDLNGREPTVTISRVVGGTVVGEGGKKSKKPVLFFEGKDKPLAIGATIGKTIQAMYGPKTEGWVGKRITLFTSTTHSTGGEEVECIRVRPQIPAAATRTSTARRPSEPEAPGAGFPVEDESEDDRARRLAAPTDDEVPQ